MAEKVEVRDFILSFLGSKKGKKLQKEQKRIFIAIFAVFCPFCFPKKDLT
jgi:hypothetical protein